MGYRQLAIEERCEIARLCAEGSSIREVARRVGRSASTVSRELRRNSSPRGGYRPSVAHGRAWGRRWSGARLERDEGLRRDVLERLGQGWSPRTVADRLAADRGRRVISHESIYRFVFGQLARLKDYNWRHYLPRGKSKRGLRGRKGGSSASTILLRRPIAERPAEVSDRRTCGHWEADTMLFGRSGELALLLHERCSRVLLGARLGSKEAGGVASAMRELLGPLPPELRRTVTFDNGTEFARHYELHALGIETFFCDTYSPWQKGGVENAIGRQRRYLPRTTNLKEVSEERFRLIMRAYNHTPRECLGRRTPAEVSTAQVLHFKCESTFPPSRE